MSAQYGCWMLRGSSSAVDTVTVVSLPATGIECSQLNSNSGSWVSCTMKQQFLAIRHAESAWNALRNQYPSDADRYHPRMFETVDCSITQTGIHQAQTAGVNLMDTFLQDQHGPITFLVSPLQRALQTTSYILESVTTEHTVEINPTCSEILVDPCDVGSVPSVLSDAFPQWDFTHLDKHWWTGGMSVEDTLEHLRRDGKLETDDLALHRMEQLRRELQARTESTVVMVCHSETIWWLTSHMKGDERFGTWTQNCEIVDITDHVLN